MKKSLEFKINYSKFDFIDILKMLIFPKYIIISILVTHVDYNLSLKLKTGN